MTLNPEHIIHEVEKEVRGSRHEGHRSTNLVENALDDISEGEFPRKRSSAPAQEGHSTRSHTMPEGGFENGRVHEIEETC